MNSFHAAPCPAPRRGRGWLTAFVGLALVAVATGRVPAFEEPETRPDSRAVRKRFARPPREYSSAPLWVWNDLMTEDLVRSTLQDLAAQHVRQVFVHPRPGLMTPYLGPDWFRLWKVALREAERLDLNVWIYDENSYPSGFAGGLVPELLPDSRGLGLSVEEASALPTAGDADVVAVHRRSGGSTVDVTADWKGGKLPNPTGPWIVSRLRHAPNSAWHANRGYVNLLTAGVTEKFLELTLGAYDRAFNARDWKRVPGIFTDEPNIRPAAGLPWCPDFPEQFARRRGYDLMGTLPSLTAEIGDWRRVRHDFFATASELFVERWARPYYLACDQRGLELTGHYWDHEWPRCLGVPDNMAMAAWQHRPGIDVLMNRYDESTHAQFGNVRICREISSLADQLGRERTLVELYGASGWDLRFEDMKRLADWVQVLGLNTISEHLSYATLRGARKRDHPQSFSYHEPWWPAYQLHADYLARLSAVLSQGEHVNRILVLEPTTTAWMYQGNDARLREIGDSFSRLLMALESAQVEYDLGCEDVISRNGGVVAGNALGPSWASSGALKVGLRSYPLVIVPEHTETLNARTRSLLNDVLAAGGQVIGLGPIPPRTGGIPDAAAAADRVAQRRWETMSREALLARIESSASHQDFVFERSPGDRGILFHHRREWSDAQAVFLVNSSIEHSSRGRIRARAGGVEIWDPASGKIEPGAFSSTANGVIVDFDLPPSGSRLLFFPRKPVKAVVPAKLARAEIPPSGPATVRRVGPNVLTLDYLELEVAGTRPANLYFYEANRRAWQAHGFDRNPWDNAVQFRDEVTTRVFPAGSGFQARYRFVVEGPVPPDLAVAVERPDLYRVEVNGQSVPLPRVHPDSARETGVDAKGSAMTAGRTVRFEDWWLDRSFGRIPIATRAHAGENTVALVATPFTVWHEIEPVYVLGSFALAPGERGWTIQPDAPLSLVPRPPGSPGSPTHAPADATGWNRQGHPFHAGGVVYRQGFEVAEPLGRFTLKLPDWYGSVARVEVNGQPAGWITSPPWELDVTRLVRRGGNNVEVTVFGTLRNTLGPHHGQHAPGSAWPAMFQQGPASGPPPGEAYSTMAYGLFAPFVLTRSWSTP